MIKKASELNPGDRFIDPYYGRSCRVEEVLSPHTEGMARFQLSDENGWWITSWDNDMEVTMIDD